MRENAQINMLSIYVGNYLLDMCIGAFAISGGDKETASRGTRKEPPGGPGRSLQGDKEGASRGTRKEPPRVQWYCDSLGKYH
jgi:hypothetical protein